MLSAPHKSGKAIGLKNDDMGSAWHELRVPSHIKIAMHVRVAKLHERSFVPISIDIYTTQTSMP